MGRKYPHKFGKLGSQFERGLAIIHLGGFLLVVRFPRLYGVFRLETTILLSEGIKIARNPWIH